MKKLIAMLLVSVPMLVWASGESVHLERAPDISTNTARLQHGAKLFVNYCLNCHSASMVRYNRLRDIGLSEQQIKDNLLFTVDKVGETMKVAMNSADAKVWFGAAPPDLSLIARSRASGDGSGPDWLYTYMRSFYKDESRPTGWNNTVFPNVGMPHVLWELQGTQVLNHTEAHTEKPSEKKDHAAGLQHTTTFKLQTPGKLTAAEYDEAVADLVGFLSWMGEPQQNLRKQIGVWALLFLTCFFVITWRLNAAYWKDIK